jgi:hypothetical protein
MVGPAGTVPLLFFVIAISSIHFVYTSYSYSRERNTKALAPVEPIPPSVEPVLPPVELILPQGRSRAMGATGMRA